jgi:hypothetical protein
VFSKYWHLLAVPYAMQVHCCMVVDCLQQVTVSATMDGAKGRTVFLSGLHKDYHDDNLYGFLESKRLQGGDVNKIERSADGKCALVTFEDDTGK